MQASLEKQIQVIVEQAARQVVSAIQEHLLGRPEEKAPRGRQTYDKVKDAAAIVALLTTPSKTSPLKKKLGWGDVRWQTAVAHALSTGAVTKKGERGQTVYRRKG